MFVNQEVVLPNKQIVIIKEGEKEAFSVGSYSIRLYAHNDL